jgi:putative transposase
MSQNNKIIRNYKYRLYPTATQSHLMDRLMSLGWRTYNDALSTRIDHYKKTGESLSYYDLRDIMCASRNQHEDFKALMSSTVEALCKRVIDAYTGTFSRIKAGAVGKDAGFPKAQKRRNFRNLPFRYRVGCKLFPATKYDTYLRITNIGMVQMHYHRAIPDNARIKRMMLCKSRSEKWYAVFAIELQSLPEYPQTGRAIGIDIGMAYLLAMSDGRTVDNPRWYYDASQKRRVLQRKLDRQRRANNPSNYNGNGTVKENAVIWRKSNRQRKTERQLRKLEEKVKNQRWYFWHTMTDELTRNYDLIAIEDLSLEFMQQNKRLAMGVYDAAYATFWQMLDYKAEARGVQVVRVNPAYTSQTCHECGAVGRENRKTQARFKCVSCGHEDNADINAAKNILHLATKGAVQVPQGVK